ncbi:hotdog fold thioesterase [Kytococcus sp. Marseille-QA3725]
MTWHDGLRSTATDGTDLSHVRTMWETDDASSHMGIEVLDVDRVDGLGRCVARMTVGDQMVNGHGTTHGGMVFVFCDSVFALTCNTSGTTCVAAHCDIDFLAPTKLGDVLVGVGTERFTWGRSGMTDVVVHKAPEGALDSDGSVQPSAADISAGGQTALTAADVADWPVVAVFTGRSRALPKR